LRRFDAETRRISVTTFKLHKFMGAFAGLAGLCSVAHGQSAISSSAYVRSIQAAAKQSGAPLPLVPSSMVAAGEGRPHVWVTGFATPLPQSAAAPSAAPSFCETSPAAGVIFYCWNGLQTAYGTSFPGSNGGAGITVAIVDAFHYANAYSDLALFSEVLGLPPCPMGTCFNQVNQVGGPPRAGANASWETETMLDLDAVHSLAPNAKILLVEGDTSSLGDLDIALGYAVENADIVSNSYGSSEFSGETTLDVAYAKPVLFSSGDHGAPPEYPCASPYVTCVGGTTLFVNASLERSSETGWSGSGGGCSTQEAAVAYQTGFSPCAAFRAVPDVAADANPNTGLLVYDSGNYPGELVLIGGTSLACPLTAAMYANILTARVSFGQPKFGEMNTDLYSAAARTPGPPLVDSYFFYDITSGNNGFPAGPGYDLVTGLGASKPTDMGNRFFGLVP
jgi:subtilase family serine protease